MKDRKADFLTAENCNREVDRLRDQLSGWQDVVTSRDAEVADLRNDRDTWKSRAEFSYTQRDKLEQEIESMRQQLADREAQIVMLRDGLKRADDLLRTSYDHVSPLIREALAATDDLKDVRLCHAEPVALAFSTGTTNSMASIGFEYGASLKMNTPASGKSLPLYRAWEPK